MELWCTIFRMQFRKLKENRETDKQATPSLFPKTKVTFIFTTKVYIHVFKLRMEERRT